MKLKEVMDKEEKAVKILLEKQEELIPYIVFEKNNERILVLLAVNSREDIKEVIDKISFSKPKWVIFVAEAYIREVEKEELNNYRCGENKKLFEQGDERVKEVVIIQGYDKSNKIMRVYDKETFRKLYETTNFDGFLAISDIERVFW